MATAELTPAPPVPHRDPFPRAWTPAEVVRMREMGLFPGRDLELIGGQLVERAAGGQRPVVFTRKEYYALDDGLFFDGQRVQLVGGVIVQESPMNPPHATSVSKAANQLGRVFADGFHIRVQVPVDLGLTSEPHPDVSVVMGSIEDYEVEHPKGAVLVVEVADTTLESDTHTKANLYASAGVADYWVIDLVNGRVIVFREPRPAAAEEFGHDYGRLTAHGRDESITPLAAPEARVNVADLLPREAG